MSFWDNFQDICKKRGVKPNTICEKLGVSSATMTKWKTGSLPKIDKLISICQYFDVSADDLLDLKRNEVRSDLEEKYSKLNDTDKKIVDIILEKY